MQQEKRTFKKRRFWYELCKIFSHEYTFFRDALSYNMRYIYAIFSLKINVISTHSQTMGDTRSKLSGIRFCGLTSRSVWISARFSLSALLSWRRCGLIAIFAFLEISSIIAAFSKRFWVSSETEKRRGTNDFVDNNGRFNSGARFSIVLKTATLNLQFCENDFDTDSFGN